MTFVVTHAFLLSILWTLCSPLIKFILPIVKGGSQMVAQIIELIESRNAEGGLLKSVVWVKCFLKG